jgi:hypothetical protein
MMRNSVGAGDRSSKAGQRPVGEPRSPGDVSLIKTASPRQRATCVGMEERECVKTEAIGTPVRLAASRIAKSAVSTICRLSGEHLLA